MSLPSTQKQSCNSSQQDLLDYHRFAAIIKADSAIIVGVDKRCRITLFSKGCEVITGFNKEEMMGKSFVARLIPRKQRTAIRKQLREILAKHVSVQFVTEIITRTGEVHTIEWTSTLVIDGNGSLQEILVLGIDITADKQAEERLHENEARYQSLVEISPDAITLTDLEGRILMANPQTVFTYGAKSEAELMGQDSLELVAKEDRQRMIEDMQRLLKERRMTNMEYHLQRIDGSTFPAELSASAVLGTDGRTIGYIGIVRDITDRKRIESALRERERRYRALFECTNDAVFIISLELVHLEVNQRAADMLGYTIDELVGMPSSQVIVSREYSNTIRNAEKLLAGESLPVFERILLRKDGTEFPVEINAALVRNSEGAPLHFQSVIRDITERKQMDAALRESETKYRVLVEQSLQGLVITQEKPFRIVYANPAYTAITGYRLKELLAFTPSDLDALIHPEDRELVFNRVEKRFSGEIVPTSYEYRIVHKSGVTRWVNNFASLIKYEGQSAIQSAIIDISEHKFAEHALRGREKRYRALFERTNDAVFIINLDLIHVEVNQRAAHLLGYTINELVGMPVDQIVAPIEIPKSLNVVQRLLDGEPVPVYERVFRRKDGTEFPVEINAALVSDAEGKPLHFQSVVRDITERKRVEEELRASEERFRALFEYSPDLIYIVDLEGVIVKPNPKAVSALGYSEEEMVGTSFIEFFAPCSKGVFKRSLPNLMEGGFHRSEMELLRKDGSTLIVDCIASVIRDSQDNIISIVSFHRDITEVKEAELALKRSEERYRELITRLPEGIGILDIDENITFVNSAFASMFGYDLQELVGMSVLDLIDEGEIAKLKAETEKRKTGESSTYELVMIAKDGSRRVVRINAVPERGEDGTVQGTIAVVTDITERKQAEAQLRETEARQRALLDAIPDLMFQLSFDGTFISYQAQQDDLYLPPDVFLGKRAEEVLPPSLAKLVMTQVAEAVRTGEIQLFEYQLLIGDKLRDWEGRAAICGEDEILVITRDITERKRAEQKIHEARTRVEFFNDLMAHDLTNIHQGILSLLELIQRDPTLSPETMSLAQTAQGLLERSADLITKVKKFTRIDTAPQALIPVDLAEPFFAALEAIQQSFHPRKMQLSTSITRGKHKVLADEFLIDLFYNLFHNAMRYDKEEIVRVAVLLDETENTLEIKIQDHGPGITDEEKEHIITRLSPKERGIRGVRGRGIGLTLVQRIIDRYGGKIWVEDRIPGDHTQGASFVIQIPKAKIP